MRWRVRHTFDEATAVEGSVPGYPSLDVAFEYDPDGGLRTVLHEVEIDDSLHAGDAVEESTTRLRALWGALDFLRGNLPRRSSGAVRLVPATPGTGSGYSLHGEARITASGVVTQPIRMPAEEGLSAIDPSLLTRATAARDEEDAAHALRDYDAILEAIGKRDQRVRHARNFVSHGGPLSDQALLAFVRTELSDPMVDRFDPGNRTHVKFVTKMRNEARVLVDREIRARLR